MIFGNPRGLLRSLVAAAMVLALATSPTGPSRAEDHVMAGIQEDTAALVGAPRAFLSTSKKALAAQAAIKRGDYTRARQIAEDVLARSRLQAWQFYPFSEFMDAVLAVNDDAFREQLDAWVSADPTDAVALIIRAHYHFRTAWALRGSGFGSALTRRQVSGMLDNIAKAAEDADSAIKLRDDIPYSHLLRMRSRSGSGTSPEFEASFQAGIARFPGYYALYEFRLDRLTPKWGGSAAAMLAFVDQFAGKTDKRSPLRFLYLSLYGKLLDAASTSCRALRGQVEPMRQCVSAQMQALVPPDLEDNVVAALRLSRGTDASAFARMLDRTLYDMVTTAGGEAYSGAILQLTADELGSDNRLKRDVEKRGNYALDAAAGIVWSRAGFYDNAVTKYHHALEDIAATAFPDDEARDLALIEVYERLAGVSNAMAQPAKVIAYTDAAIALGGPVPNKYFYLACRAYHTLKLYAEGAAECARLLENGDGLAARYWFAFNQEALGHVDEALAAYAIVAKVDGELGANAVIQMSLIYANRNDPKAMLAILNAHPSIYNERVNSKTNVAVAFNNRCYAYMKLGELQKALDDCTTSLRFGSLPDAFTKQEQLVKMLKGKKA
jgi:tetratricopeptide (TPR) repeat protein